MIKIKMLLCALALAGCSAGVEPTLDFGIADASSDGTSSPDASAPDPDGGPVDPPDLGVDAGDPPDLGTDDPDLGTDLGPPDAGPPACVPMTDPPVTGVCADGACCAAACRSDGTCPIPVSGTFCTCFYMRCAGPETECSFDGMVCPCR